MRDKRLHGSGKAAAVHAPRAGLPEKLLCDGAGERDPLFLRRFRRIIILQQLGAGAAGFFYDGEK